MKPTHVNCRAIMAFCAHKYNTTVDEVLAHRRDLASRDARMAAICICRTLMVGNRIVIANHFRRSDSAISYSVIEGMDRMKTDATMKRVYDLGIGHFGSIKEGNLRKVVIEVMCGDVIVKSCPADVDVEIIKPYPTIAMK
jgi:hypothetical protein